MGDLISGKTFAIFDNPFNQKLISTIRKFDAEILLFPPLETEKIVLDSAGTELIADLQIFDWIIFADVLAVDFFLEILEENNIDSFELDEIRVCAPFENVSDRLRFAQLHADVIPNSDNPIVILEAIKNYASVKEFKSLKFLIVKEKLLDKALKNTFTEFAVEVCELLVYQISNVVEGEIVKQKLLLKNGAADELVISAPEDLIALKYLFAEEPFELILSEVNISAASNLILQTLFEHKLKPKGLFQPNKIDTV